MVAKLRSTSFLIVSSSMASGSSACSYSSIIFCISASNIAVFSALVLGPLLQDTAAMMTAAAMKSNFFIFKIFKTVQR